MSPRTRFILTHPIRAHRFHRAATATWHPAPTTTGDTMKAGRPHSQILNDMIEAGDLTPEEAAEEWRESHADDERNDR